MARSAFRYFGAPVVRILVLSVLFMFFEMRPHYIWGHKTRYISHWPIAMPNQRPAQQEALERPQELAQDSAVWIETFRAHSYEVDLKKAVTLESLCRHFQEAAWNH